MRRSLLDANFIDRTRRQQQQQDDRLAALGQVPVSPAPGGVTDHGLLTGLADDDHTQYLNNARGDARYDAIGAATAAQAAAQAYADGKVIDSIANGDTTHAPSRNAVYDALALKADASDSGWVAPSLLNSWANFGGSYSAAGYRKVGSRVFLRGLLTGGTKTDGTSLFVLPSGFVPFGIERFATSVNVASSTARIVVDTSGNVTIFGIPTGSNVGVSGISFFVD